MSPVPTSELETYVSPLPSNDLLQYVTQGFVSASKAYTESCVVAARITLCVPPCMGRFATHSGCAYIAPSVAHEKSFPNVAVATLAVVSAYSCEFTPSRDKSLW